MLGSAENQQQNADDGTDNNQDTTENRGDFKHDEVLRRISALGWFTDLCELPEPNFIRFYGYLVVSIRKYRHVVLKEKNYKTLTSHQLFFKGTLKGLKPKPTRTGHM